MAPSPTFGHSSKRNFMYQYLIEFLVIFTNKAGVLLTATGPVGPCDQQVMQAGWRDG